MSTNIQPGDIRVLSQPDGTEIYVTAKGRAEIWAGAEWRALTAIVSVTVDPKFVMVRISHGAVQGLPYPTGKVSVMSNIAGWEASATVS